MQFNCDKTSYYAKNDPDINAAVNKWIALFTKTANHHAPLRQTRLKGISHPWMSSQLSKEMQYRDKLYKSAIKLNTKEQSNGTYTRNKRTS